MTHSETIADLATALAKAQGEMAGAKKDSANPFFKSKYADLASVWEACRGPLTKYGLSVVQAPTAEGTRVSVETLLLHTSGQWVSGVVTATAKEDAPQAVGSTITYLRRYALQSFAGIAPEDDDAEAAQGRPAHSGYSTTPALHKLSAAAGVTQHGEEIPADGLLYVQRVDTAGTKNPNVKKSLITFSDGTQASTIKQPLAALAEQLCQERAPVRIEVVASKYGPNLENISRAVAVGLGPSGDVITASDIPF